MNTKLLNVIFILLLVGSIACTKFSAHKLQKIKSHKFSKSALGKTIVQAVQIQMQTGGSVDIVVRLLQALSESL